MGKQMCLHHCELLQSRPASGSAPLQVKPKSNCFENFKIPICGEQCSMSIHHEVKSRSNYQICAGTKTSSPPGNRNPPGDSFEILLIKPEQLPFSCRQVF